MTFKPAIWQPIAVGLSVINLVAVGFAAGAAEPWHAAGHAGLAMAFGMWAQRMRKDPRRNELPALPEELEAEMSDFRRELSEVQERLDFVERLLAQEAETRRLGPER